MRTRRIIGIIFVVAVMVVAFNRLVPRQPEYQGRSLASWLKALDDGRQHHNGLTWELWNYNPELNPARIEAQEAIRQMGTNCLPYLLHAVTNRDSALKKKIVELLGKQARFKVSIPLAANSRRSAEVAFHALGPTASNAIPALTQALTNAEIDVMGTAGAALAAIGPDGWVVLTRELNSSNSWSAVCASWALGSHRAAVPGTVAALIGQVTNTTRGGSAALAEWALGEIGQDSEEVIPGPISALRTSNGSVTRWSAAQALGTFGTNAQSAVPALLQAAQDPDRQVQMNAKNALKQIEPDVSAKNDVQSNHNSVSIVHH